MQRRRFTAIVGTGVTTAVAGCSSDSPESEADGSPESTDANNQDQQSDSTNDGSNQGGEASFEVTEYEIPETASIGSTVSGTILVENVGGSTGGFTTPLYIRTPDSDWTQVNEYTAENVEPGETAQLNVEISNLQYINRYEIGLGQSENTAVIQTVSASLDWGTEYTTPEGYRIRVDEPNLQSTYTYETYSGDTEEKSPEDRGQWAFVNVYVKNETGQTEYSPLSDEFALVTGNSQFDSTFLIDDPVNKGEQFEGGELQPGIERSGWIVYELPADLSTSDLTMAWSNTTYGGEISVNWE
jgi:hypothetical protein